MAVILECFLTERAQTMATERPDMVIGRAAEQTAMLLNKAVEIVEQQFGVGMSRSEDPAMIGAVLAVLDKNYRHMAGLPNVPRIVR